MDEWGNEAMRAKAAQRWVTITCIGNNRKLRRFTKTVSYGPFMLSSIMICDHLPYRLFDSVSECIYWINNTATFTFPWYKYNCNCPITVSWPFLKQNISCPWYITDLQYRCSPRLPLGKSGVCFRKHTCFLWDQKLTLLKEIFISIKYIITLFTM